MSVFLKVSDQDLNLKIKSLAAEERKLTKKILLYIAEVDKRKLYLKMAYPSLFDYLTKEVGYSAGSAYRRIDAARLIHKIPEVSDKIESGQINLSQISKVQQICRQIKKQSGQSVDLDLQKEVLLKLEAKNNQQTDLILAQEFNLEVKSDVKIQTQQDESKRLEMTLSKEEMDLLKKAQSLLSNKTGGGLKDTVIEMAKRVVQSAESKKLRSVKKIEFTSTVEAKKSAVENHGKEKKQISEVIVLGNLKSKQVSRTIKKQILIRDQVCQFKDLKTGKICGANHFLEVDHIVPKYLGGKNNQENLRLLCRNHNQYRFQKDLFN